MRLKKWVWILCALLIFSQKPANAYTFWPNEYRDIKEVITTILRKYPPENFFYVGIGRSPISIMAAVEALEVPHRKFPLSKMTYMYSYAEKRTPEVLRQFHSYLSMNLPSVEQLQGRQILIVDQVGNGYALVNMMREFQDFYDTLGAKARVSCFGMIKWRLPQAPPDSRIEIMEVGATLGLKMRSAYYNSVAPYGSLPWYKINEVTAQNAQSQKNIFLYTDFVSTLRSRFARDAQWQPLTLPAAPPQVPAPQIRSEAQAPARMRAWGRCRRLLLSPFSAKRSS